MTKDLTELLTIAGIDWNPNRWNDAAIITLTTDHKATIVENDGTYFLTVNAPDGIHTEAQFAGIAAQVAMLATIDALRAELA